MGTATKQEWIRTQRFGLELEVIGITRKQAADAIQSVVGGNVQHEGGSYDAWAVTDQHARIWRVVSDGSLYDASYDQRVEMVTPPLTMNDMETLQEIIRRLRRAGARKSAHGGLHCHVDGHNHTPKTIRNLVKVFNRLEKLIYLACGVQQNRLGQYCKPNEEDFVKRLDALRNPSERALNRAWFNGSYNPNPHRYDNQRYHALNLNNIWREHHTIEFRFGEVPDKLHAGKVKAFIVLCLALSAAALTSKGTTARRKKGGENPKYAFRVAMLNLGLIGAEFANVRKHLMANVPGNSAWKDPEAARARREAKPEPATTA
jgi:hypothetical protein